MNRRKLAGLSSLELCHYYQEREENMLGINSLSTFHGNQPFSQRTGYSRSNIPLPPIQRNNSEMKECGQTALRRTPGKRQGYSNTDQYVPGPSLVMGRPILPPITKRRENKDYFLGNISDPVGRSASDKAKSSQPPSCRVKESTGSHKEKNAREPHERDEYFQKTGKVLNQTREMRQNQFENCGPYSMPQASRTPTTGPKGMNSSQQVFLSLSQQMQNYQTDGRQFRNHAVGRRQPRRPSMMVCFQNGGEEERVPRTRVRRYGICEVTDAAHGNRTFVRVLHKRF